ncbi:MAG: response regulator [Candidatus Rokubacteria bacterium]|nr:response regulator [Candidatus Rokubacteria bacterium]
MTVTVTEPVDILLVEDSPEDVELTLRALRKARIANQIEVAEDGAKALEYLFGTGPYAGRDANLVPKLVLLDLKLPKLNGLEVLTRLRADERTQKIPVVVLTSSREDSDVAEAYRLGVNSYIVKPVEFEGFAEAVGQLGLYWLLLNEPPR